MTDLLLGARWILAIVLIGAAVAKLHAPGRDQLADAIQSYGVLPNQLVRPVAAGLPWLELTLGAMLCFGVLLVAAASCVAFLLAAFGLAVGWHVSRGRRFACGCGSGETISWMLAIRDLVFSGVAVAIAVGPSGGLAIWPGWAAQHVAASAQAMVPVPLTAITLLLGAQLLLRGRRLADRSQTPEPTQFAV
jgi:Methylamine utilisation protein MauE